VYVQSANLYLNKRFDEDQAQVLGSAIKDKVKAFEKDNTISREQFKLLKDIQLNLRTASEAAWNRIHNDVTVLNNAKLSASFTLDDDVPLKGVDAKFDPQKNATKMKTIATTIGATNAFLDEDQTKELRESNPKKYSEYCALLKPINALIKKTTFNFVRASGDKLVLIDELKKHLEKKGIPHNLVNGLVGGYIDEKGKCYTAEKRMLDKVPYGNVVMNPKYDPATDDVFVCKAVTKMRKEFRTVTMNQTNKKKKFSDVGEFMKKETEVRDAWRKDVMAADAAKRDKRKQIIATIIELIYQTNSRIGGVGNATKGEPTYGMSTLQVQHLKLGANEISYNYTGKKGAEQTAHVKVNNSVNKKIFKILTELVKGKGPNDLVFTYNNKKILGEAVNIYLKSIGSPVTIHKFRNVAGTTKAKEILKQSPFKKSDNPSQSAVEKWFKEEAVKIGELLMHRNGEKFTGSTSIASYIDPQVIIDYFDSLGLRKPSFLK
jgi:DNA topoisomerase IB